MNKTRTPLRKSIDRMLEGVIRLVIPAIARLFYRVRVRGLEHVPASGGVLVLSNHMSYVDTIILTLALPRKLRFTSFAGFFSVPVLGAGLRLFGAIPIARDRAKDAVRRTSDCLRSGEALVLFPEGKISTFGRLLDLKGGFELIARRAATPVIVVHLDGLWGSVFSFEGGRAFFKWPRVWRRDITVTIAPALPAREATVERVHALLEEVQDAAHMECGGLICYLTRRFDGIPTGLHPPAQGCEQRATLGVYKREHQL